MLEGWLTTEKRTKRGEAVWVANLMNATGNFKEPVTADSLLAGSKSGQTLDMEKLRLRAEQRRKERLAARERA